MQGIKIPRGQATPVVKVRNMNQILAKIIALERVIVLISDMKLFIVFA